MAKHWTNEEIKYLQENYAIKPIQELCGHLGFTRSRIYDKAALLGLKKEIRFVQQSEKSISTQFKKGMTSWNKGLKLGSEWGKPTQFKPGQTPHNKLPEEIKEISLLRRRLLKNVKERMKRYDQKQNS